MLGLTSDKQQTFALDLFGGAGKLCRSAAQVERLAGLRHDDLLGVDLFLKVADLLVDRDRLRLAGARFFGRRQSRHLGIAKDHLLDGR